MTSDEIIELAKAAGAANFYPKTQTVKADNYLVGQEFLERFAKLVAAKEREALRESFRVVTAAEASAAILHEREACAKVADEADKYNRYISREIANAIRARGEA